MISISGGNSGMDDTKNVINKLSARLIQLAAELPGTSDSRKEEILRELEKINLEIRQEWAKIEKLIPELTKKQEKSSQDDSFWDMGEPRKKKYSPPDFGERLATSDISVESSDFSGGEKIPPMENGIRPETKHIFKRNADTVSERVTENSYTPLFEDGSKRLLLSKVTVSSRHREEDTSVTKEAEKSHNSRSILDPDVSFSPVPYISFIPQYHNMSSDQVKFYLWWRENIRLGRAPKTDTAYIVLYIYEIPNLPHIIPPDEGMKTIAFLWTTYRTSVPRLDYLLCEWVTDYSLIHNIPLPDSITGIMDAVVPKSVLKEFYLDFPLHHALQGNEENLFKFGRIVCNVSSNYDFRSSAKYSEFPAEFEHDLPLNVGRIMVEILKAKIEPFSLSREYTLTRDSFSGAYISDSIKKRIDVTLVSFTRRAETRTIVTSIVKLCENKLRRDLDIKSKLKADPVPEEIKKICELILGPDQPLKEQAADPEYMKLYEAEDSGFDFSTASVLEENSWVNTARLTGDDSFETSPLYEDEINQQELPEGALSSEEITYGTDAGDIPDEIPSPSEQSKPGNKSLKGALEAALNGTFKEYCQSNSLYEGDMAGQLNDIFIDITGDIILEPENDGINYVLVEDYRKDAEDWLLTQ